MTSDQNQVEVDGKVNAGEEIEDTDIVRFLTKPGMYASRYELFNSLQKASGVRLDNGLAPWGRS